MSSILTWYEISDQHNNLDIDQSIQSIQDHMYQRNPEKYGDFLSTLGKIESVLRLMMIPNKDIRVELFKYVYYAMRLVDDIVDGDTNPPLSLDERKEFMQSIIWENKTDIRNSLYEELNNKIVELSRNLGLEKEMSWAINEILLSMNYDLLRIIDDTKIRSKEDLKRNFHSMDIIWTIVGTCIIFGIQPYKAIELIMPLGEACRIMYNLRDFWEDIEAGLINIPKEDLSEFWITKEELLSVKENGKNVDFKGLPSSIKSWFHSEIQKIEILLEQHDKNMKENCDFSDQPSLMLNWWRNMVLKKVIFPKTYINEIKERIPHILEQIS